MNENYHRAKESLEASPMKALQIIQTVMLLAILAVGGWIGSTTVESTKAISRMEEEFKTLARDNSRLADEMTRLSDAHNNLDRRVTIIETRGHQ